MAYISIDIGLFDLFTSPIVFYIFYRALGAITSSSVTTTFSQHFSLHFNQKRFCAVRMCTYRTIFSNYSTHSFHKDLLPAMIPLQLSLLS